MVNYYIFVDGAAAKNGRTGCRAAWAFAVYGSDKKMVFKDSGRLVDNCTNNRAELMAIMKAVEWIRGGGDNYIFYCDSQYAINCISKWYDKWCANGVVNSKKNIDLISRIKQIIIGKSIVWVHVKSHKKKPEDENKVFVWSGNDYVDRMARELTLN